MPCAHLVLKEEMRSSLDMPTFCEYGNCQNLASSAFNGYCNKYHWLRAQIKEKKDEMRKLEAEIRSLELQIQEDERFDRLRRGLPT
jgi:hypothetical protein